MALIVRIDVDRPYGKHGLARHLLSRLSSDLYFPKVESLGYLNELKWMLGVLNQHGAKAYAFFRRCTLPSSSVLELIAQGGHQIGLHLEDSRSFATMIEEKGILERHIGRPIFSMSKHGSGGSKYGFHHHAPYEPQKYVLWARQAGMKLVFGNLENPALDSERDAGVTFFPAAFWLEPFWRDVARFNIDWLVENARTRDIVLLVHPENVLESPPLAETFTELVGKVQTTVSA